MNKLLLQEPIDKVSLFLIGAFTVVIGGLVIGDKVCGNKCFFRNGPRVEHFSWENQQVGAKDRAFILTFDRPMDKASVEQNLVIKPPLPGKISWAGRRLAYTLETPIPYGQTYQVKLSQGTERFRHEKKPGQVMESFVGEFQSRDRALAYIGTQGEEEGRLVFYNVTQQIKRILTPPDLVVMNFEFYPQGDRILFSAAEQGTGVDGLRQLQLYTVTTGVNNGVEDLKSNSAGKIEQILDNKTYQNNQFDLSPDGKIIVVQRVNRENPADFDLWVLKEGSQAERLKVTGGEFEITPDSQTVAVARGEGISILPLKPEAEPLDFLPKFGQLLNFTQTGDGAAMVDFNTDDANLRYTRSLFYVNNQGIQKELLNTQGSIIDCQFTPMGTQLYCLLTELLSGDEYEEQPYFAKFDLKTGKMTPLAKLSDYQDIKISLAPDGLALLFDQVITSNNPNLTDKLTSNSGEAIVGGQLWLLIPPNGNKPDVQADLKELPLVGFRPQWLP
ncbi:Ig-like domain-containing protein [Crocosphaera sp. UHCC 0190]|uniref:Ig-like domain-containing protein n=1 Tax=Crocosphaera sp. UHCC 0190 TaxID=3110246 RepID=UPI002B1F5B0C|nr:Ig-like domain-containing protein [Crocosphaera sp. UHCC 0190]MEA5508166.1 Ig-like domain-containing protein [Crocosphaera sp. UHCC 0190]